MAKQYTPKIYDFSVRKHLPTIGRWDIDGWEKAREENPFKSKTGPVISEGETIVGEARWTGVSSRCYINLDGNNFCRTFQGLDGRLNAVNFFHALDLVLKHIEGIGIDLVELNKLVPAKYGHEVKRVLEWNEGLLTRKNYSVQRYPNWCHVIKKGSRVYQLFEQRLNEHNQEYQ